MLRAAKLLTFMVAIMASGGLAPVRAQTPEPRIALVIGNSAYKAGALATAANDAGLIAETLQEAGFDVVGARDLDQDSLRRAFRDFLEKAASSGPETIAVVYLAGYGLQYAGENYFAPIEATIARDSSVTIEALRLSDVTRPLADLPLKSRVVILDAARANPFSPSGQPLAGGLALVEPEDGALVAFNAAPGTIAPQDTGDYGVYAKALSEMIRTGGVPVDDVFTRARLRVSEVTRGQQVPWHASRLAQPFSFFEAEADADPATLTPRRDEAMRTRPISEFPSADEAYAAALERDTIQAYQEFLVAYPRHPLTKRVNAMLAARREALTWRRAVQSNTPSAYWTYVQRYPRGPHVADARRRLSILSAAMEPPAAFERYAFDVEPPPTLEYEIVEDEPHVVFYEEDYVPPPPPPVYFLPPRRQDYVDLPPPRVVSPGYLPVPMPIFTPGLRPWRGDRDRERVRDRDRPRDPIPLPRGVSPRDAGAPARFVAPQPQRIQRQRPVDFSSPNRVPPQEDPRQFRDRGTPQGQGGLPLPRGDQRPPILQQTPPSAGQRYGVGAQPNALPVERRPSPQDQRRIQQEQIRQQQIQRQQQQQQLRQDQQRAVQEQRARQQQQIRERQTQQQQQIQQRQQIQQQQRLQQQDRARQEQMRQQQDGARRQQQEGLRRQQQDSARRQQQDGARRQQMEQQRQLHQRQIQQQQQQRQQQMQQQQNQQRQIQQQQQMQQQRMQQQMQQRQQQQMQQQRMQQQMQQRQQQQMQQQRMQQQMQQRQIQQQQQQRQPQQRQQRRDCGNPGQPPCR